MIFYFMSPLSQTISQDVESSTDQNLAGKWTEPLSPWVKFTLKDPPICGGSSQDL